MNRRNVASGRRSAARARGLRSVGGLLLLALLLVAALRSTFVPQAVDAALQSTYYRIANSSHTEQRVLLVEADQSTVEQWGPPGWEASQWDPVMRRIAAGRPAALVVLDSHRMFRGGTMTIEPELDDVPLVELSTDIDPGLVGVDSLGHDDLPLAQLGPVLDTLGLPPLEAERLWIHYLWPPSRLPSVTLQRIGSGKELPATVFEDKIVVLGLTSHTHRDALPTPVGVLTSPEIVSHALAMMADGRGWYEPSPPLRILVLALVLVVTTRVLRNTTPTQGLLRAAAICAGLLVLDLLTFSQGIVRWGVAGELLAVLVAMLGHWYLTQKSSAQLVESVSARVSGQLRLDMSGHAAPGPPQGYWQDMAEVVRAYLDVEFTGMIAELPAGRWHLEPRAFMQMTEDDILERRRDVRRPPYRAAFLTHKPSRCERPFLSDSGRSTLAVPLVHQGHLLGMWMASFEEGTELGSIEMMVIEWLGAELGRSIAEARRGLGYSRPIASNSGDVAARLSHLVEGVEALGEGKQQVVDTFESLPMGLLVANVWGRVMQVNGTLRQALAVEFPEGIPNNDLSAVLSRLTGSSLTSVHEIMRSVVRTGETFRIRPAKGHPREATYLLMAMRTGATGELHAEGGATTRLVLMTVPDDPEQAVDMLMHSA